MCPSKTVHRLLLLLRAGYIIIVIQLPPPTRTNTGSEPVNNIIFRIGGRYPNTYTDEWRAARAGLRQDREIASRK